MVKHRSDGREWWCLPGGAILDGESPANAALRELSEECQVAGRMVRETSRQTYGPGDVHHTFLIDIGGAEPRLGRDPEFAGDAQILADLRWLPLHQIPERDRAFLWAAGLLGIGPFGEIVLGWGDDPSYPPGRPGQPVVRIAGADGCKGGWISVQMEIGSGRVRAEIFPTAEAMLQQARSMAVLAIDIPIGLTEAGPRACDLAARRLLGPRASSVFPAPVRAALPARTWAEASALSRTASGKGLSQQSFGILPRIREVDSLLRQNPSLQEICREVHPEVSFCLWNGGEPMRFSKKTAEGRAERAALVEGHFGGALEQIYRVVPRSQAAVDDILDGFAALWTAERCFYGRAGGLPGSTPRDSTGLPMEILA